MKRTRIITLLALTGLMISTSVFAQGFLIPIPRRPEIPPGPGGPFSVKSQYIDVNIRHQVATSTIEQVFINQFHRDLEGVYLFPIPEDASISKFTMWMNGEEVEGEIVEARRARQIYEDIVRRTRDPGLLEYVGQNLFRARVFPIPARGQVQIKISYEEILDYDAGLVTYRHPFKTDCCRSGRIGEVSMAVTIESDVPIKSVYSPSHEIDARIRGKRATCGFELSNTLPDRDFLLYYTVSEEDVGLNLLTHRIRGEEGYFMILLSPGDLVDRDKIIAKDVVFVIDKSGSMKGEKIAQAKAALEYCIKSLNSEDRFNIITFSTNVNSFADRPVGVSRENRARALDFIDGISARGGTDINQALTSALELPGSDNPQMIIFLTDGLPTVGETNIESILHNLEKSNRARARIFSFGVGYDVNTALLDQISISHRATVEYIRPEEDIEVKVSRFYDKVSSPVLSDISLRLGGIKISDVYPRELPDIFDGTQLVVLGRFDGRGTASIELNGRVGGKKKRFVYEGDFHRQSRANSFIPRIWANRKIAYLLSEIKLHGTDRELVDKVIELSLEHGIITPYTSYLILEEGTEDDRRWLSRVTPPPPGVDAGAPGVAESADRLRRETKPLFAGALKSSERASGKDAAEMSITLNDEKEQSVEKRDLSGRIKYAGEKRFVLKGDEWIDAAFEDVLDVVEIEFLSGEYFKLLDKHPEVKEYLALGEKVTFVFNNQAYRITQ